MLETISGVDVWSLAYFAYSSKAVMRWVGEPYYTGVIKAEVRKDVATGFPSAVATGLDFSFPTAIVLKLIFCPVNSIRR